MSRDVELNYLRIPIQYHFVSAPLQKVSFIFSAGLYVEFLTSYADNVIFRESGSNSNFSLSLAASDDGITTSSTFYDGASGANVSQTDYAIFIGQPYNSTGFGATFSSGVQFKLSDKIALPMMINYQTGFGSALNKKSLVKDPNSNQADVFWDSYVFGAPVNYRNSFLGLIIGLKINLTTTK
jgi:hypothetical protein